MQWELLARRLREAFTAERLRTPGGRVLVPASGQPVNLQELVLEAVEEEDGDEYRDLEDLRGELRGSLGAATALELLERRWRV